MKEFFFQYFQQICSELSATHPSTDSEMMTAMTRALLAASPAPHLFPCEVEPEVVREKSFFPSSLLVSKMPLLAFRFSSSCLDSSRSSPSHLLFFSLSSPSLSSPSPSLYFLPSSLLTPYGLGPRDHKSTS